MKTYKILMAEPSDMIVKGFQEMLGEDTPFQVCGRVPSADGLAEALGRYRPAVLLINPSVLGSSTISQMGALMADFPNVVPMALAYQFFPADTLKPFVAVIDVFDNKFQIESKLKQALKSQSQVESEEGYELTQREKDVLVLVAKGLMNKEIADKLNLSVHTVITHRKNITHKTDIKSVAGLTVYALLNNLIDKDEVL